MPDVTGGAAERLGRAPWTDITQRLALTNHETTEKTKKMNPIGTHSDEASCRTNTLQSRGPSAVFGGFTGTIQF